MKDFLLENSNTILLGLAILPQLMAILPSSVAKNKYLKVVVQVLQIVAGNWGKAANQKSKTAADLMRK